jgi:hypothetical protein
MLSILLPMQPNNNILLCQLWIRNVQKYGYGAEMYRSFAISDSCLYHKIQHACYQTFNYQLIIQHQSNKQWHVLTLKSVTRN